MPLPQPFLNRLARIVPAAEYERVLASFSEPRAVGFRINTLLAGDQGEVISRLEEGGLHPVPVDGLPLAYTVPAEERGALLATTACEKAVIYVQDLASQLAVHLLDPQPGEAVLDLCAAPGSKTGQIAAKMAGDGEIAAVEVSRKRFFRMRANLERQGATAVRTFHRDGSTVWRHRPDHFDRVLVDAPCSTEGRFRTSDPDSIRFWHPRKPREMARKQWRLIYSGFRSLKPGGVMVYSTCTFAPEENEAIVSRLAEEFGDALEVEALDLPPFCKIQPPLASWEGQHLHGVATACRLLPTTACEPFFLARFRKNRSTGGSG